jgi:hypothetical protein
MPCPVYDKLTDEIFQAMRSEDMARGSSPKEYPHNSEKKRQEAAPLMVFIRHIGDGTRTSESVKRAR